jgi:hypothetical protein
MSISTLGRLLREQLAADERSGMHHLQLQADDAGPQAQRELLLVAEFFHSAQDAFSAAIRAGTPVPQVQLGNGHNSAVYRIVDAYDWTYVSSIRNEGHRYYPLWARFEHWCSQNELRPVLSDQHTDEKGTWWLVSVAPADSTSAQSG